MAALDGTGLQHVKIYTEYTYIYLVYDEHLVWKVEE